MNTINKSFLVGLINSIKVNGYTTKAINTGLNKLLKQSSKLNKLGWYLAADKLRRWINAPIESDFTPFKPWAIGNSKLPFLSWSTLPGVNCPGAGDCWLGGTGFCYSPKAWRYPAAFARQLQNTILESGPFGRAVILQHLDKQLARPKFKNMERVTLRLYVDGDFSSLEILKFWMDAIKARPKLEVYGYSKSLHLFKELSETGYEFPSNYTLNGSSGSIYENSPTAAAVAKLPIFRGEFIAVPVKKSTLKAWRKGTIDKVQSKEIRSQFNEKVFICPGKCGECTTQGHACGNKETFNGVKIVIPAH
tara:strand:+ start:205 stop:1122 length:918 start_codon:yes stop_codon:yes gene_type:complete